MRTRTITLLLLLIGMILAGAWWYSRRPVPAPAQERSAPAPAQGRSILLYYYDPSRDTDENGNVLCSAAGLVAVKREIPQSDSPVLQEAIQLLLEGKLTPGEKAQGIISGFPLEGVQLVSARVDGGDVTLVFNDPQHRTSGGACRVEVLRAQIEATVRQFGTTGEVRLMPEELFQP